MSTEFNPLELANTSKTFCVMPWVHQYAGPQGEILPCCVYDNERSYYAKSQPLGSLKEITLSDAWNNERTRNLRLKFLNGETDAGCTFCDKRRDSGPFYDLFNKEYLNTPEVIDIIANTKIDGSVEKHKLFYLDVRWNNLCNFKCRMCSPHYSTSWIEDHKLLYDNQGTEYKFMFSGKTEDDLLEQIIPHLETATTIYFAGGEPLIQKEHYEILERLIELGRTDIKIKYNTNFSQFKLKKYLNVLEYWKRFEHIDIGASIDGSYAKAEYWRHGTKWDQIVDNLKNLKSQVPQAKFKLAYTLSWVNAHNLVDLHKEWVELGYIDFGDFQINTLDTPPYYSLKFIPEWKKKEIEDLFLDYLDWGRSQVVVQPPYYGKSLQSQHYHFFESVIKNAIQFMYDTNGYDYDPDKTMLEFFEKTYKLDRIRGEDFFSTFPEHLNIKQAYNR